MTAKFNCCKKDFKSFVCLGCFNVFHPSCLNRGTNVKIEKGHTIYCSKKCEEKVEMHDKNFNTNELYANIHKLKLELYQKDELLERMEQNYTKKINTLEKEINSLNNDAKEKEAFYNKKLTASMKFEEEVLENEETYLKNMRNLAEKNNKLQQKIIELNKENDKLEAKVEEYKKLMEIKIQEADRLSIYIKEMLLSIKTLENENIFYANEIDKIKMNAMANLNCASLNVAETMDIGNEDCNSNQCSGEKNTEDCNRSHTCVDSGVIVGTHLENLDDRYNSDMNNSTKDIVVEAKRRSKILVIGDESARHITSWLHLLVDTSKYVIDGVVFPNMELLELSKMIGKYSLHHSNKDFVICIFNTSNVSNHKTLNTAAHFLLPLSKTTNLIILSKCNHHLDIMVENLFNSRVNSYKVRNRNVSVCYKYHIKNFKSVLKYLIRIYIPDVASNKSCKTIVLKTINI